MIRGVLVSVVLLGMLLYAVTRLVGMFENALPDRVTRIDIFDDQITYRTNSYPTVSMLAVGLKAAKDPPRVLGLHDCSRMEDFRAIIDLLRDEGFGNFEIELPENC